MAQRRAWRSDARALLVPALAAGAWLATAAAASAQGPACTWSNYCSSTSNSTGAAAHASFAGSCLIPDDSAILLASPVPNQPGIFYYGATVAGGGAGVPFGDGLRCVGDGTTPLIRMAVGMGSGNVLAAQIDFDASPITLGSTWHFQAWFRDPQAGGAGFNLSDGLTATFGPAPASVRFASAASDHPETGGARALALVLEPPTPVALSIPYTLSGSASAGADCTVPAGPLLVPAGASAAEIVVTALDDDLDEGDETLVVTLGQGDDFVLGAPAAHALTLLDDDGSPLDLAPDLADFGRVELLEPSEMALTLRNEGQDTLAITALSFLVPGPGHVAGYDFEIDVDHHTFAGGENDLTYPLDLQLAAGATFACTLRYTPSEILANELVLRFAGDFQSADAVLRGEGTGHGGGGYLHVVIDHDPLLVVDYDQDGSELVALSGSASHTHEPGRQVASWQWREDGVLFASTPDTVRLMQVGANEIELTIADDGAPADSLADSAPIPVHPPDAVPGVLARYYVASAGGAAALLDNVPASPDFVERREHLRVDDEVGIGGSPYESDVLVRLVASFELDASSVLTFTAQGGAGRRVLIDGALASGPVSLGAGDHGLELRYAVNSLFELPLLVDVVVNGLPAPAFDAGLTHDELGVPPRIHSMPSTGVDTGGNLIAITGFGFYPRDEFVVHWGALTLDEGDLQSWTAERLELLTPPGTGVIQVSVETPAGVSNARTFTYSPGGPVPIVFSWINDALAPQATCGDWGPDGRFWVGMRDGRLRAFTFDDDYEVVATATYPGVSALTNNELLGLAFDPFDAPGTTRVLVAHANLFAHGGGPFPGPSPFTGAVSALQGPDFGTPVTVVSGLPVSNHDHGINGLQLDHNGDLLICVGGLTNAGVLWPSHGNLPESPLSGAIVKAELSRPDFEGEVHYRNVLTGLPDDNQVHGEELELMPGSHVSVHAPGLRNPFDLVFATSQYLYATDNGPNANFGPASTGPTSNGGTPHPATVDDELLLVEYGNYYGHPNRARGRFDDRQYIYRGRTALPIPGVFRQWIGDPDSSTDGLCEYRSDTFGGQMRGNLLGQTFGAPTRRIVLSPDGRGVESISLMSPSLNALDVQTGPGGAILALDYTGVVKIAIPIDQAAIGLTVYDITPWRAPSTGGRSFVIGGKGFGTLATTSVKIGGLNAVLTSVSPQRIRGIVPANPSPTGELVDVVVRVGGDERIHASSFRYLFAQPGLEPGKWRTGAPLPAPMCEVGAGVVNGVLYQVGEVALGEERTFAYDIENDTWIDTLAHRPYDGNHHAAEVFNGRLYLIGGLSNGATGRVQIYNPATNTWSLGADMPWWAGGSIQTALIDGKIYAAGGILAGLERKGAAVYDPVANTWSNLPDMPVGLSHAAAGTDGDRFWIFGGRPGGNTPSPGYDIVQVFDPATNSWSTSNGGSIAPMPAGRAGTGKAIWYRDEFYVFGGETSSPNDPDAEPGGVFSQVLVYRPATDTWRQDAPMPTARHGVFPVLHESRIFLAGGSPSAGLGFDEALEIFTRQ